ncbi:MAG: DUF5320 domain-containing protein [Bacteroidales bacterium]
MPGFDRTGPNGQGPRTGRGLGKCKPNETEENSSSADSLGQGRRHRFRGRRDGGPGA